MATVTITDKTGQDVIAAGLRRIVFIPWAKNSSTGVWEQGATGFSLDAVVGDSTSLTQEDPSTTTIDRETSDEPLYEVTTNGNYSFSCENASWDPDIIENCLGFEMNEAKTEAYAPAAYVTRWATVELQFENGGSYVIPKLKLNSKSNLDSLKTNIARMTISGTAYSTKLENGKITPFYWCKTAKYPVGEEGD